jgi:predicted nucleic acid-binding protein
VKTFLDTNIFVYANDRRDEAKQRKAISTVSRALRESSGVVSTQVLMEYAAVAITKLGQARAAVARQLLAMERLEVHPVDGLLVRSALDLMAAYSLSFWDAAIVAAAQAARCEVILSDDLGQGTFAAVTRKKATTASRHPFAGRLVIVGDAGCSRCYLNRIESAYTTSLLAARTAVNIGIWARAFRKGYSRQAKAKDRQGQPFRKGALWSSRPRVSELVLVRVPVEGGRIPSNVPPGAPNSGACLPTSDCRFAYRLPFFFKKGVDISS